MDTTTPAIAAASSLEDDYIPQPCPHLSDEAAAQILDFLYDLVVDFESAYTAQILRHRHAEAMDYCDSPATSLDCQPIRGPSSSVLMLI